MTDIKRKIFILEDQVVNQIAAGEVIERPSSVVKELVENSIDAGATEISVLISNGGSTAIEVRDNGCGMNREDALVSIQRFGTSKISKASDLEKISTLGFRGEAIPSIASVSEFLLKTSTSENKDRGTAIIISGGDIISTTDYPMARGTHIEVNNLFYNVPARRKFLRTEGTETGAIRLLFQDIALAYPKISFHLYLDGKESAFYPAVNTFDERVEDVFKSQKLSIRAYCDIKIQSGNVTVEAAVCEPIEATSSAQRLRLIVNGRTVRDRTILRAVRDAYGSFIKPGKHPWGVVKLTIPAEEVDVNAHPQKAELRFKTPDKVFLTIKNTLRSAISRHAEGKIQGEGSYPLVNNFCFQVGNAIKKEDYLTDTYLVKEEQPHFFIEKNIQADKNLQLPTSATQRLATFRYIGQVFKLFLLFEGQDTLAIIDMHAAHERIVFARLKEQHEKHELKSQVLLIPEIVDVPVEKQSIIEEYIRYAKEFGFDLEQFGDSEIAVRSVPVILANANPKLLINDLLSVADPGEQEGVFQEKIDAVIARLACHGSIRHGRELKEEEAYALVNQMIEVETSGYCPHGRPVVFYLSESELANMFGRT